MPFKQFNSFPHSLKQQTPQEAPTAAPSIVCEDWKGKKQKSTNYQRNSNMWNLASTAASGISASPVHPLSPTIVVGKNVNGSIRSLE